MLSHGASGMFIQTKIPNNIFLILYTQKGSLLKGDVIPDILHYHQEQSYKTLSERMKHFDFMKINSKTFIPEVYTPGMKVNNMYLGNLSKDEIILYNKSLTEKYDIIPPLLNCGQWNSLSSLLKDVHSSIPLDNQNNLNIEIHLMACRGYLSSAISRKLGFNKKINFPKVNIEYSIYNNIMTDSYTKLIETKAIELYKISNKLSNKISASRNIGILVQGFLLSLSILQKFFKSKRHFYLNIPENQIEFFGIIIDYVKYADLIEDSFNELNLTNNETFLELLKLVVHIRSICLVYLADFGYDRNKDLMVRL
ncbi:putative adhesin [Fluviispira sanaruensis]